MRGNSIVASKDTHLPCSAGRHQGHSDSVQPPALDIVVHGVLCVAKVQTNIPVHIKACTVDC